MHAVTMIMKERTKVRNADLYILNELMMRSFYVWSVYTTASIRVSGDSIQRILIFRTKVTGLKSKDLWQLTILAEV